MDQQENKPNKMIKKLTLLIIAFLCLQCIAQGYKISNKLAVDSSICNDTLPLITRADDIHFTDTLACILLMCDTTHKIVLSLGEVDSKGVYKVDTISKDSRNYGRMVPFWQYGYVIADVKFDKYRGFTFKPMGYLDRRKKPLYTGYLVYESIGVKDIDK